MTKPVVSTFKIIGMHCTSCSMNIDFELEDLDGVLEARTHYARQESVVTFYPDKLSHTDIIAVISKLGYDAVITVK